MAIVLDTVVSNYLTAIKDALTTGTDTGTPGAYAGVVASAAQNYLRAQDMATALELLAEALSQPGSLIASGGSTTTVVDANAAFVAGAQIGNTFTILTATEAGIVGESRVVSANTTTTLTFVEALPATVTALDTYSIEATFLDASVDALRDGKGIADATPGNPYGSQRDAIQGLMLGIETLASTVAERNIGRAGLTSLVGSTDTVVILSDSDYRIDQFKGMRVVVTARGEGIVSSSNENSVTLRGPMAAAAQAADAVAITVPVNDFGGTSAPKVVTHPGAQPGENIFLADLIDQFQTLVEASTIPVI